MFSTLRAMETQPVGALEADRGFLEVAPQKAEEIPGWNLGDLYPDEAKLASDIETAKTRAGEFKAAYAGKLADLAQRDPAALAGALAAYESLSDLMGRIGSYSYLNYVTDTGDATRAKLFGDVRDKLTVIGTELLFFELELNRIDDGVIDEALANEKLGHYRPWLTDLRKERPYQLADDIERLFHEKAMTGPAAWSRLFNETLTALRFDVDGETLTLEPALNLLSDANPERRAAAAQSIGKVLKENVRLFTLVMNTLAKDKEISDRWRGFPDVASSRHLANRVEPEVVDALVAAVRASYPRLSHRYYALKAKWLGVDTLNYWDRNAPISRDPEPVIAWKDAHSTVIAAYRRFSPKMAEVADGFFRKNWIDAPVRDGKSPGAFSHPTVPSAHPYIMMNYLGKPRDVMTLAHELGHGVHQVLANAQGALMAYTPLTLAETASVFGEMLTFKALLNQTENPREKRALLAQKVEDKINTVVRQIAFYQFERLVHEARRQGELTSDQLGAFWLQVQSESLGPAILMNEGYDTYWTYVSHFVHSPFYVYAYAFGDCLVNSLYAAYERAPEGFEGRYLDMLRAGGTKHHTELLAPFGLDATDPGFWSMGLSVIEDMISELETLEDQGAVS
ncbi:M3 family oligoendopeptidase [Rhodomicrobium sp.]|uniref:M3 family oligoendopeptidase n=1 Tax=Rhodomicrobium sp. TaxID=2720632 RepID=UPI0039E4B3B3